MNNYQSLVKKYLPFSCSVLALGYVGYMIWFIVQTSVLPLFSDQTLLLNSEQYSIPDAAVQRQIDFADQRRTNRPNTADVIDRFDHGNEGVLTSTNDASVEQLPTP
ncbi:MAG: hypothetical protein HYV33_05460 [Candidatus Kerfeldbacteria bacterium]|nr:hypothetical protein [Candidatus Kerfeldbacteria bacterium]